ncbi:MAG: O-antigen ligase family protein [Patescibacteria group bacterium]
MENKNLTHVLKGIIWVCLAVILFSPLYVSSHLFFPFITTKTYAFQISVEVMLLAYLLLCWADGKYRIHTNLTVGLLALYLIILTVASIFSGNDFYHSFWSNNERGDGILMLLHLFLFSVVLTGFFRSIKEWLWLFDLFIVASFCVGLVALDQYLALSFPTAWTAHLMDSSNGARLAATIGNAGYVGGYMVFGIFTALFMALKRSQWWARTWYITIISLEIFIAIQTFTRGAYISLAVGIGISAIYLMWFYFKNKYLKFLLVVLTTIVALLLFGIFIFKDSSLVKGWPVLLRISSISLVDVTSNNRFVTWQMGWKGFLDKPLLGWGQENFYQVFDKYYTTKNSEQWFDRCHNMICDRVITGGIIGLLSYLALLLLPFLAIWKYYRQEYKEKTDQQSERIARRYLTPIIFSILILAYIIQNMFIFEALATYVPLIMVLSFVGLYSRGWDFEFWENKKVKIGLAAGGAIFLIVGLPMFNLSPLYANIDFIKALSSQTVNLDDKVGAFEEVISRGTLGSQEYRRHYFNFYEQTLTGYLRQSDNQNAENNQRLAGFANKMDQQLQAQVKENPYSVSNYLQLIRFYDLSYFFDVNRLNKALATIDYAISLSPGRPQIYYEAATSNYYFGGYYESINDEAKAREQFRLAVSRFYDGASRNVDHSAAFDQLAQFLSAVSQSPSSDLAARALTGPSEGNSRIIDITAQMVQWLDNQPIDTDADIVAARSAQMKSILEWLLKVDPKNAVLMEQLNSLK